jgi:hypothetical protein
LSPGTLYHFRIVSLTGGNGSDVTFTTATVSDAGSGGLSDAITRPITEPAMDADVGASWAVVRGDLPSTADRYRFEYGRTTAYGHVTRWFVVRSTEVVRVLRNLHPSTTYHYRVVTQHHGAGNDRSFTTSPRPNG